MKVPLLAEFEGNPQDLVCEIDSEHQAQLYSRYFLCTALRLPLIGCIQWDVCKTARL
jgi:hypothetical protein